MFGQKGIPASLEEAQGKTGTTRRVIEIQSDLFQKGRLENEIGWARNARTPEELAQLRVELRAKGQTDSQINNLLRSDEQANIRAKEGEKLEPYRNTWHERVIREEVKKAAQDGKTKLQFPTGETAMKIEGLGQESRGWVLPDEPLQSMNRGYPQLDSNNLKVGLKVRNDYQDWIITDVLGDGKFKAVPQSSLKNVTGETVAEKIRTGQLSNYEESFDISGKVDTNNPIYKFYEKEVGKYLKNKYGATLVTDPQGVKWWEVQIKPEMKKLPIEAFGVGAVPLLTQNEDE